ncbi:hypothetical protein DRO61_05695, partial [Candidatus Bathyarchaeota archaeon]
VYYIYKEEVYYSTVEVDEAIHYQLSKNINVTDIPDEWKEAEWENNVEVKYLIRIPNRRAKRFIHKEAEEIRKSGTQIIITSQKFGRKSRVLIKILLGRKEYWFGTWTSAAKFIQKYQKITDKDFLIKMGS